MKDKNKKVSLLRRYSLLLFITTITVFIGIVNVSIFNIKGPVKAVYANAIKTNNDLISTHVDSWFEAKVDSVNMYMGSIMDTEGDTQETILGYLYSKPIPADFEYMMVAWDRDNGIGTYNSKGEHNATSNITEKPYYIAHKKGQDIYIGDLGKNNLGIVSMPMMKSFSYYDTETEKNETGVVVGFLSPKSLQILDISFYNTGKVSITDATSGMQVVGTGLDTTDREATNSVIHVFNKSFNLQTSMENSEVNFIINKLAHIIFAVSSIAAVVLMALVIMIFKSFFKGINKVKLSMDELTSGDRDLTKRLPVTRQDEISNIMASCNNFVNMTHETVLSIRDSKQKVEDTYKLLDKTVKDNKHHLERILNAMLNVNSVSGIQNSAVESTASAVTEISSNIESLNKMVETQSAAVTQASAAVEEMIGNINSVTKSVESMAGEFNTLSTVTKDGISKNSEVNDLLVKIAENSNILQDANKTISSVASQTNLLAMNAAIEAAHAGTAGKGFSVVADEIRKLAEESAKQSKQIGTALKDISEQISDVVDKASACSQIFMDAGSSIDNTSQLVDHISNAMIEQQEGSKQILDALNDMKNSAFQVTEASSEMEKGSKLILETVASLESSQASMKTAYNEISGSIDEIQGSTSELNIMNADLGKNVNEIDEKINQFKL